VNFIRETDPYLRDLDAWKKGHGFSNREALERLAAIWDEFKEIPERKKVIYGNLSSNIPKTDLSCGSCVHDLLTFVWNWRAALEHEVSTYFEGVQVAEVIEPVKISFDKPQTFPQPEPVYDILTLPVSDYSGLKMHQLRSLAKKKGIVYTNKTTSKELIELLNAKV